jgi:ABC-type transport system involved in multi-copper enzyme maturation permease subunit
MKNALRYEWMRLRTLRSTWWLTGLALLIACLLGLGALGLKGTLSVSDYGDLLTGGGGGAIFLVSILLSMIGVFAIGHEYRYGTIRPTLTALPRRSNVLAAKVIVVTAYVFVVALLALVLRYLIAVLILGHRLLDLGLFPTPMARVWIGSIVYTVIFALVGLALAGLFRNIPAAIVTVIVLPVLAENILRGLLGLHVFHSIRGLAKVLPFSAGSQIFRYRPVGSNGNNGAGFEAVPSPVDGLLIFIAFLVIVLGLSWVLFEKRDA